MGYRVTTIVTGITAGAGTRGPKKTGLSNREVKQAKKKWGPKPPRLIRCVFHFPQNQDMKTDKGQHKNQGIDRFNKPERTQYERHDRHERRRNTNPRQKCTHERLQNKE
jgi:hypothetical protein